MGLGWTMASHLKEDVTFGLEIKSPSDYLVLGTWGPAAGPQKRLEEPF